MERENDKLLRGDKQESLYFVGPLNLNRKTKQANTVMGTELLLDAHSFDALDMLATQENKPLTFEQLYAAVWDAKDGADNRDAALVALNNLIKQVSAAGKGFMWIEYSAEAGYTFGTRWGHNWQTVNKAFEKGLIKSNIECQRLRVWLPS